MNSNSICAECLHIDSGLEYIGIVATARISQRGDLVDITWKTGHDQNYAMVGDSSDFRPCVVGHQLHCRNETLERTRWSPFLWRDERKHVLSILFLVQVISLADVWLERESRVVDQHRE